MKKVLPLIIVLITISLIGIVYIQYSRIQNLLIVKEEQLFERIAKSIDMVGKDLSYNNANRIPKVLRRQRKSQLTLGNNMPEELYQPSMVSDRYTQFEILEKLPEINFELVFSYYLHLVIQQFK